MTVILIACIAFAATMLGGIFALRFRDNLHLILGFSAGAVIGVALFDLLPESMALSGDDPARLSLYIAGGFLAYLVIDRLILLHPHSHDDHGHAHANDDDHTPAFGGALGALTLSAHSFLDGVAIGAGFQASPAVGVIVTAAVVTHDFSDGINTVSFILRGGGNLRRALPWLLVDAIAPVLGAASTLLFRIPQATVGLVLAVFAGCFLYLGASDLIPESQHAHPRAATTVMTLLGAAVLYIAVRVWSGG
ncbi:MAG TPA: ZIP family metal transporter [Rhizomicrobium sp.]|jgi:ZIP family zinc transporter|nr:ZIP family metal transporter [Rhizomicrobium sp.]